MTDDQRMKDYLRWHHLQVRTGDIDPVYPVLRWLADAWRLDQQQRAWLCVCHVVYYHLGSTLTLFEKASSPRELPDGAEALREAGLLTLPTTTERRGHRDWRPLAGHLAGLRRYLGDDPLGWLGANGWEWTALNDRITELRGNGRWAAYKLAEMLQKVADVPTHATDAGHKHSSGPRKGLADLFGELPADQSDATVAHLDALTLDLAMELGESDIAQVETSLCDFHSLARGRYYLGHDIDSMQEVLTSPRVPSLVDHEVWAARSAVFDPNLLGELCGWNGIQRDLKPLYRDHGVVDYRDGVRA